MNIEIEIPEDLAFSLKARWENLSRGTLEALAVEAYREGIFTPVEVGRLLGHASRWQTEAFLADRKAYLPYAEEDLIADSEAIHSIINR